MMEDTARRLFHLLSGQKTVYVTTEPGLPDFSDHKAGVVNVSTELGSETIPFDRDTIGYVWGMLGTSVFSGEYSVISWGIHPLVSYAQFYTGVGLNPPPVFYDLKVIERYMGLAGKIPEGYAEALSRMKVQRADAAWVKIWRRVHRPLVTRVLPDIETTGLIHAPTKRTVYTHYEVEYQSHGRMQAFPFSKGFCAHTVGKCPDYRPRGDDTDFVLMDFSAMEVRVLAHLSKCPVLGQIVDSGEDVYGGIYTAAWGGDCPSEKARDFVKGSFLAVIFGMGAAGLAKAHKITVKSSQSIIDRYYRSFPRAFEYVVGSVPVTAATVRDALGRPRRYEAGSYLARNFVIQAPSATVCLDRLAVLHGAVGGKARIAMHIHDGYCIICHRASTSDIYEIAKAALESECDLLPGLRLKVSGKVGPTLDRLAKPEHHF